MVIAQNVTWVTPAVRLVVSSLTNAVQTESGRARI